MEEEFDITIDFPPAMLKRKRKSDEVVSNNNLSLWWRHSKTEIKNEFKSMLKEWYLPEWDDNIYRRAEVHFTILRTNHRKMDPDSLGSSTYKWALDCLTEQCYIVDDDRVRVVLNPTLLGQSGNVETIVRMQIKLLERYEMTIDELRENLAKLTSELENVGGEKHVKAASGRARKILGEIKNATPQLRRDMIELDK